MSKKRLFLEIWGAVAIVLQIAVCVMAWAGTAFSGDGGFFLFFLPMASVAPGLLVAEKLLQSYEDPVLYFGIAILVSSFGYALIIYAIKQFLGRNKHVS